MTLIPLPTRVIICGASAEGNTELNAFDNALMKIGIGDCNMITVSSIIPKKAVVTTCTTELMDIPPGTLQPAVMAKITSQQSGKVISAHLAYWKKDGQTGYIAEHHGFCTKEEGVEIAKEKLREMLKNRNIEFNDNEIKCISIEHEVKNCGCALCVALYL